MFSQWGVLYHDGLVVKDNQDRDFSLSNNLDKTWHPVSCVHLMNHADYDQFRDKQPGLKHQCPPVRESPVVERDYILCGMGANRAYTYNQECVL